MTNTNNLKLLKKDPAMDGNDTFNIKTMLNDNWDKIDSAVGDTSTLPTTDKTLAGAIKEVFTQVDKGKTDLYSALIGKGVVPGSRAFADLVAAINIISRGGGNAPANTLLEGYYYLDQNGNRVNGTMVYNGEVCIVPEDGDIPIGGYYEYGSYIQGDSNFTEENLRYGVDMWGRQGWFSYEPTNPIAAATVLAGRIGFVNGQQVIGSIPTKTAVVITPSTSEQIIPGGYYGGTAGAGKVAAVSVNSAIIKVGSAFLGVNGTYDSEATNPITAGSVLANKNGWVNGAKVTGNIPVKTGVALTPGATDITIPQGYYDGTAGAGKVAAYSCIKSIQRGSVNIKNYQTLGVAITSVNLSQAIVLPNTGCYGFGYDTRASFSAELTSSTNVQITRQQSDIYDDVVNYVVVEFYNVKSLQRGTFTLTSSTAASVTVNTVNTAKSLTFCSFYITGASGNSSVGDANLGYTLASSSAVQFTSSSGFNKIISWQLIEFN